MALKDITITRGAVERTGVIHEITMSPERQSADIYIDEAVQRLTTDVSHRHAVTLTQDELTTAEKQDMAAAITAIKAALARKYGD